MGVFDAEDDYTDAASPDHRPDKRNYNLDHLARMNFRRSARNVNNFRDRDIPRDLCEIYIYDTCCTFCHLVEREKLTLIFLLNFWDSDQIQRKCYFRRNSRISGLNNRHILGGL